MKALLGLAHAIDWINDRFASLAKGAVLLSCVISCLNAVIRYVFNVSSNGWLEIQWYLFAACVMLGAAQVLRVNEHVRVDVIYGQLASRKKVWIDLLGLVFFLMPAMLMLPLGFSLVLLQAVAEIIKRIGWLNHTYEMDIHYERPLQ